MNEDDRSPEEIIADILEGDPDGWVFGAMNSGGQGTGLIGGNSPNQAMWSMATLVLKIHDITGVPIERIAANLSKRAKMNLESPRVTERRTYERD